MSRQNNIWHKILKQKNRKIRIRIFDKFEIFDRYIVHLYLITIISRIVQFNKSITLISLNNI